jgi:hypothetical protein
MSELEDRVAIEAVLTRFCYLVDTQQRDRLMEIFAKDATVDYGAGPMPLAGAVEPESGAEREALQARLQALDASAHRISNLHITVSDDQAYAVAYVEAHHWLASTAEAGPLRSADFVTIAAYENDLRRDGGSWKIAARRVRRIGRNVVVAGRVPETYTSLLLALTDAPCVQAPSM